MKAAAESLGRTNAICNPQTPTGSVCGTTYGIWGTAKTDDRRIIYPIYPYPRAGHGLHGVLSMIREDWSNLIIIIISFTA